MSPSPRGTEVAESPWATLAFWLGLLIAMAAFAVAALAPRVVVWVSLSERYEQHDRELTDLERQIAQLERIAAALDADPQFAAALARAEFGPRAAPGRLIPVDDTLVFDPWRPREIAGRRTPVCGWFLEAAKSLADNTELRRQLFAFGSLLVLFIFSAHRIFSGILQSVGLVRWFRRRYVREPIPAVRPKTLAKTTANPNSSEKSPFPAKSFQAARSSLPIK